MRKLLVLLAVAAPVAAAAQSTCTIAVSGAVVAQSLPCTISFAKKPDGHTLTLTHDGWDARTRVTASFRLAAAPSVRSYGLADVKSAAVSCDSPAVLPGGWIARTASADAAGMGSFTLTLTAVGTEAEAFHGRIQATLTYVPPPDVPGAGGEVTVAATF